MLQVFRNIYPCEGTGEKLFRIVDQFIAWFDGCAPIEQKGIILDVF